MTAYRRSKILLDYDSGPRALLWLDQGTDGSIYVGPYAPDFRDLEVCLVERTTNAPTQTIRYSDFTTWEAVPQPKISFHTAKNHLAAQVHLRGEGPSGKTKPIVIGRWDVLAANRKHFGLILIPEPGTLPLVEPGQYDRGKDVKVPMAPFANRAVGGRLVWLPVASAVQPQGDASVLALLRSRHGTAAVEIHHKASFHGAAPFLVISITSVGSPPYVSKSLAFRRVA